MSRAGGFAFALTRLLLWHWPQPLLYFAVVHCYWDNYLLGWQVRRFLALAVGLREAIYFLTTLLLTCLNPAYFLVDYSKQSHNSVVGIYRPRFFVATGEILTSCMNG